MLLTHQQEDLIPAVIPSSSAVSLRMSRHPRRDTRPEIALRQALHRLGYRYRVQYRVPGRARRTIDIAFARQKVAVFVDGCFWHGCGLHRGVPASNSSWWRSKLSANANRDAETDAHLRAIGWRVLRVWEHEDVAEAVARIRQELLSSAY
jgi:DNA mismatch endonuclease (patch repair protein)